MANEELRKILLQQWRPSEAGKALRLPGPGTHLLPKVRRAKLEMAPDPDTFQVRLLVSDGVEVQVLLSRAAMKELAFYVGNARAMIERDEFEESEPSGEPV